MKKRVDKMPNITIHEKVGYEIGKRMNIHSYDYYLGLMAPDTPNLEGFAPKEERWMAHQRKKDYDEWRKSILDFYQKEKENYPKDFLLGYYIHILTDIVYDDYFYIKVREYILKDYTMEEAHQVMRQDMNKYYFKELEEIKEVLLSSKKSYNILNIEEEKLLLWKEKELSLWKEEESCKYISKEIIEKLIEQVYNELQQQIDN